MGSDPGFAALLAGMRRIFLRGFQLDASIGIHEFERSARQRLLVNVDLWVDPPAAAAGDSIGAVVDYDFVRDGILALTRHRHFNLQETLIDEIVALCLAQPGVLAVGVSTEKPDVYPDSRAVGVEIFRATPAFRARLAGD